MVADKFIVGGNPPQSHGREETETATFLEILRTGITEIQIKQVRVPETVSDPSGQTLITLGNVVHAVGAVETVGIAPSVMIVAHIIIE